MEAVNAVLKNPLIKNGLAIAAPEIAIGVELVSGIFGGLLGSNKRSAEQLLAVIDQELANVLKDLATTKSKHFRRECEIRAHTLLGILMEWDKVK